MNWVKSSVLIGMLMITVSITAGATWKPELLARNQEISAALEAGPETIQKTTSIVPAANAQRAIRLCRKADLSISRLPFLGRATNR